MRAIRVLTDTNDDTCLVVTPGTTTEEVRSWLTSQYGTPGPDLADEDRATMTYLLGLAVEVATSAPLDGAAAEAVASGLRLRTDLEPEVDELLAGPLRLAWDGPGVEAGTSDGSWAVTLEAPDPDRHGAWLPVSSLWDGAGWQEAGLLDHEVLSGADADPTDAAPYQAAEERLLSRWGITRDRLTHVSAPW